MRQFLSALTVLMLFPSCAYGHKSLVNLVEEVQPKTVMISVNTVVDVVTLTLTKKGFEVEKSTALVTLNGAGVYVSPNGHVLSCNHLFAVGEVKSVSVCEYSGECMAGEVLYREERRDLSLLHVSQKNTPYAKIADPRELRAGQEVVAVGNPHSLDFTVTRGIISALNRDVDSPAGYNLVQTDAAINPGNSGGPLFNREGELVGINILEVRGSDGLGFSAESGQIMMFLTRFRGLEKIFKGRLS